MAGYSTTPLLKKLGIKPGDSIFVLHAPDDYYEWISPLPENVVVKQSYRGDLNFIHLFVTSFQAMSTQLKNARERVTQDGMIWVSWPKKSSGVKTDLDENKIRDFGLSISLVDVKVCAVDSTWSGLKFVIPVKQRIRN